MDEETEPLRLKSFSCHNIRMKRNTGDQLVLQKRKTFSMFCDDHIFSSENDYLSGCGLLRAGVWEVQDQGVSMVAFGRGPSSWFIAPAFLLGPHRMDLKLIFISCFSHWTPWRNPWIVFLVAARTLFSVLVVCSWRDRRLDSGNRNGEGVSKEKVVWHEAERGALAIAGVLDQMRYHRRQESWKNVVVGGVGWFYPGNRCFCVH